MAQLCPACGDVLTASGAVLVCRNPECATVVREASPTLLDLLLKRQTLMLEEG